MGSVPPLLAFLLMIIAGWVHRRQLILIEFLQAENRLLKERLRGKRIRFTDAERALLARKAKAVGRKSTAETRYPCFSGYADAMAPAPGGPKMGLQQATRSRPAGHH